MRKKNLKYYKYLCGDKAQYKTINCDKDTSKNDLKLLLYKMNQQEELLRKTNRQSSFGLGVLQNITGDAVFELFLRGASFLFKR